MTGHTRVAHGTNDSYVLKQGDMYYYRRRVPADIQPLVGRKFWKKTLRTSKEQEAKERARAAASEHDQIIKAIRSRSPAERHELAAQRAEMLEDKAEFQPDDGRTRLRLQRALEAKAKLQRVMMAAAEQRLDTLPAEEREAVLELGGVEAFFNQVERDVYEVETGPVIATIARGHGGIGAREADIRHATFKAKASHVAKDQQTLERLGLLSRETIIEEPNNPRINTAMEKWLAERKQGPSASGRHKTAVRRFVAMHGNIPVGAVTKPMVRDYVKRIETLGDHRRLPSNERGDLSDPGADMPRIAAPTVDRHLVTIKALLKFCVEQDWLSVNVATGLRSPKDTRPKAAKRRPFTRDERNQLMRYAIGVDPDKGDGDMPWLIRLAAYTSCRAEELAQLARTNVRQVDGVWVIEVDDLDDRSVKNASSVKQVPLHPAIRDDFVTWVGKSTSPRVFQSFKADRHGRYVNKVSGAFGRLMDEAGLSDPRLVLHSLRHTLKREMIGARIDPDVRREILGHAPKDAHDGYAGPSLEAIALEFARMPPLFD